MSKVKHLLEERYRMKKRLDLAYIRRWKVDVDSLEDVLHDAICNALRYNKGYVEGLPFDNWFQTILTNAVKKHLRVEKRQGMSEEFQEEIHFIDDTPGVSSEKLGELLENICKDIRQEKESNQEVLTLYFSKGFTLREIDALVDQSYSSVHGIVKRFTAKMRDKYAQECVGCGLGSQRAS